jgi:hypothetical protein
MCPFTKKNSGTFLAAGTASCASIVFCKKRQCLLFWGLAKKNCIFSNKKPNKIFYLKNCFYLCGMIYRFELPHVAVTRKAGFCRTFLV